MEDDGLIEYVVERYLNPRTVHADIEIFTRTTTFANMQSIRLDRRPSGPVRP